MNGPVHIGIGVCSAGVLLWAGYSASSVPIATAAGMAGAAALGSLAPDIDHRASLIGNRIPTGLLTIGLLMMASPFFLRWAAGRDDMLAGLWSSALEASAHWGRWGALLAGAGLCLLLLSLVAVIAVGHRGPTHSILAALAATFLISAASVFGGASLWYSAAFGLGWISHLIADAGTPDGLQFLFWPLLSGSSPMLGALVMPLVLAGLLGWSGVTLTPHTIASGSRAPTAASAQEVQAARMKLKEASPEIEAALADPLHPEVERSGGNTSFAWEYLKKSEPNAVEVQLITVTVDPNGEIVGVDQR